MTSDRPHDSSTFDALWDFDPEDDDEPIPPALDPRSQGGRRPPSDSEDDRDTLLPPLPPGEYVQTMMELGELDEPSATLAPGRPPRRAPGGPAGALGLVLAPESELLLHEDGDDSVAPFQASAPRTAEPAASAGLRPRGGEGVRPATRMPSAGLRSPARSPAPNGLPVPRAPSIPPPAPSTPPVASSPSGALSAGAFDAFAALDSLESLDVLDKPPSSRGGLDVRSGRATPPGRPPPPRSPSSDRTGRTTGTAGLRLRKTTPPPEHDADDGDRVTPIAIDSAPSSVADSAREMVVRFEAKNYGGALVLAESVLISDPHNVDARRLAESCREMLGDKYLSSLGGREGVPRVSMSPDEVRDLSLDHRAGFLLSFIDGSMSIEEVLDVSSMPELDVLRIMFELRQQGAIEIDAPRPRFGRK